MGKWRETALDGKDAIRAMLDDLMGPNRNRNNPNAEINVILLFIYTINLLLGLSR